MAITQQAQIEVLKSAIEAMLTGGTWTDFMLIKCEACLQPLVFDPCPDPAGGTLPLFYVEPCSNPNCPSNTGA